MLYTSNIRGEACHRLAVNFVGVAAVIHPGGVHAIGKILKFTHIMSKEH
jgi:hypothetical protein